ncbi:hypothetical protein Dsin_003517 [Dipteronia sinensis]|uniref:CBS domain-containing protein n=1 Tax=Dipteronia sinensis TaxID=43782 RepID=A0AAE0EKF1_9ROSI|nr:hypothetical protein Dsin_003517 [Dipteronia sinensis]
MQGMFRGVLSIQEILKSAILQNCQGRYIVEGKGIYSRIGCVTSSSSSSSIAEKGLENITVADILMTKGDYKVGSWLWCLADDTVDDAARNMAKNNIGSLVVLKHGEQQQIAGIFTERDYMRKIVGEGRSSTYTRVGEIMTDENKLITLPSDANIVQAMQLMTENQIRHVPVIDGKIVGMISIVDVVRAVVGQQNGELKRLNEFIKGEYY